MTPNLQAQLCSRSALSRRSSRRTVPKALRLLHPRCCPEPLLTGAAAHALGCSAASTPEQAAAAAPGATVWGPLSLLRSPRWSRRAHAAPTAKPETGSRGRVCPRPTHNLTGGARNSQGKVRGAMRTLLLRAELVMPKKPKASPKSLTSVYSNEVDEMENYWSFQ